MGCKEGKMNNKDLKREVERLKLERQLKSLRPKKEKVSTDPDKKTREEIEKLYQRKQEILEKEKELKQGKGKLGKLGVGLRSLSQRANINKQINEKTKLLKTRHNIKQMQESTKLGKAMIEKEKIKSELQDIQKKRQKDLFKNEDIFNTDDIFKY